MHSSLVEFIILDLSLNIVKSPVVRTGRLRTRPSLQRTKQQNWGPGWPALCQHLVAAPVSTGSSANFEERPGEGRRCEPREVLLCSSSDTPVCGSPSRRRDLSYGGPGGERSCRLAQREGEGSLKPGRLGLGAGVSHRPRRVVALSTWPGTQPMEEDGASPRQH